MAKPHALCHDQGSGAYRYFVYRRDSPATAAWTRLDPANEPVESKEGYAIQDPASPNLIRIVFIDSTTDELSIRDFDMNTGLWGGLVSGGPTRSGSSITALAAAYLANGDIFVAFARGTGGGGGAGSLVYTVYNGSFWLSPVDIDTADPGTFVTMQQVKVVVEANYIHVGWITFPDFSFGNQVRHRTLTTDGLFTQGTKQTIYITPAFGLALNISVPLIWAEAGKIVFGLRWHYNTSASTSRRPAILIANANEASPTWSNENIVYDAGNRPDGGSASLVNTYVVVAEGLLKLIWCVSTQSTNIGDILYRTRQVGGTWDSADQVFHDWSVDGPTPKPPPADPNEGFTNILAHAFPTAENAHGFSALAGFAIDDSGGYVLASGFTSIACYLDGGPATVLNQSLTGEADIPVPGLQGQAAIFSGGDACCQCDFAF